MEHQELKTLPDHSRIAVPHVTIRHSPFAIRKSHD